MRKLSATQINGLRLAAEVPTCLNSDFHKPTTKALLSRGLIESYGVETVGDGHVVERFGITQGGRAALAQEKS